MTTSVLSDVLSTVHIHDVDAHITEPPDLWTSRIPAKWGDDILHVKTEPSGMEVWYTGSSRLTPVGDGALTGWKEFAPSCPPTLADASLASWQPRARLEWMDQQQIAVQMLYPNILGFISGAFLALDPKLRLACVQTYNDYVSEFCSEDPARLIAISTLPWWDLDASVAELGRCVELGHKGVSIPWEFQKRGFPVLRSKHWDPLLGAIQESGLPLNFHVGFTMFSEEDEMALRKAKLQGEADQLQYIQWGANELLGQARCILELIMGRICHRFPTLKFVSVESGMGYIPYLIDGLDWHFMNSVAHKEYPEMLLPSEYFRRQCYGTFWFESDIGRLADLYPDNFMFETDFPHSTSLAAGPNTNAPGPMATIESHLDGVDDGLVRKLLEGNARAVYNLDG